MSRCLIGLGSNLGDRQAALAGAVSRFQRDGRLRVVATSRWHETKPVGGPARQPLFLNGAVLLKTALPAEDANVPSCFVGYHTRAHPAFRDLFMNPENTPTIETVWQKVTPETRREIISFWEIMPRQRVRFWLAADSSQDIQSHRQQKLPNVCPHECPRWTEFIFRWKMRLHP